MDANEALNRLKSLTLKHLGDSEELPPIDLDESPPNPKQIPELSLAYKKQRDDIVTAFRDAVKASQYVKNRELLYSQGWRCTYQFPHQNNRVCNTVNGTYKKKTAVRKTCSKCQQYRRNPKTLLEEITEITIGDMVARGLTREQAVEQIEKADRMIQE